MSILDERKIAEKLRSKRVRELVGLPYIYPSCFEQAFENIYSTEQLRRNMNF